MTVLRPPYNPDEMPWGIRRLSVDGRGYPIPWFVNRKAPLFNGNPDFRVADAHKRKVAGRERRCWVCGGLLRRELGTFVAGPMCGINHTSSEPPCHQSCAEWAARACPFLAVPKRIRDERDLPPDIATPAGIGIKRNPGVTMLWASAGYTTWTPPGGGILYDIGEPVPYGVDWYCEGREATRAEIME